MLAADRSSLEKSMQKETPVERREIVVWPQRRDHSRSEQAERGESVVWLQCRHRSRSERAIFQWIKGKVLSLQCRHRSRSEQAERAIFQWIKGSVLSGHSVVIEADRSK